MKDTKIDGNLIIMGKYRFEFKNRWVQKFTLGYLHENFTKGQYSQLNVKNKTVIDIGSCMGDTAVYFISRGARRVIGYEPDKQFYEASVRNIELNGLRKRISVLNIPGSLKDAIRKLGKNEHAVLKMDCEGCEYTLINRKELDILKRFDEMIIEYHHGYERLLPVLHAAGFETEHTAPLVEKNINYVSGLIYARKKKRINSRGASE